MYMRMKTHITYVYTDTCMSTSINTGAPQCRNRVAEIPGSMEVSITSSKSPSDHVYICHYMSTLALSQMPEASHLLCRKPNAGIQALVLCSLRALHIFSIFMYSCICQSMIWSFSYNDTLQCLIVFTEPTNLDLCTYTYILNCCHLRRYFFLSNYYTTGQEVSKWHWVSILLTQNIAWFRKLAKAKLTKDPWKKQTFTVLLEEAIWNQWAPMDFQYFPLRVN